MKQRKWVVILLLFVLVSCGKQEVTTISKQEMTVVALSSSLAELWLLSGGDVSATTDDAFKEHPVGVSEDCINLGSVKNPSIEQILSLEPDLVLLSPHIASHQSIKSQLESFQIECKAFDLDTLKHYLEALRWCSERTGDEDSYQKNGRETETRTASIIFLSFPLVKRNEFSCLGPTAPR